MNRKTAEKLAADLERIVKEIRDALYEPTSAERRAHELDVRERARAYVASGPRVGPPPPAECDCAVCAAHRFAE